MRNARLAIVLVLFAAAPMACSPGSPPARDASSPATEPAQPAPRRLSPDQIRTMMHWNKVKVFFNQLHDRFHPLFADDYLAQLDKLPPTDPQNQRIHVGIELTVGAQGELIDSKIRKTSGVDVFDETALRIVRESAPFPAPEPRALDEGGQLRFSWEFHRNRDVSCTTANARLLSQPRR